MARGMSMEEFRDALSSDATIENEKLKAELKDMKESYEKKIEDLKADNEQYKSWCTKLANRCFVFTQGQMCISCSIECCEHALTPEEWEYITDYMVKNKMPRTAETYMEVIKLINERRKNKRSK